MPLISPPWPPAAPARGPSLLPSMETPKCSGHNPTAERTGAGKAKRCPHECRVDWQWLPREIVERILKPHHAAADWRCLPRSRILTIPDL